MALALAVRVRPDGYREVLSWDIGHVEYGAFWTALIRQLVRRGLREVHPVTSDAREGPKKALCGGRYLHKWPAILELAMRFEPATC